jgi:hypothetical protein
MNGGAPIQRRRSLLLKVKQQRAVSGHFLKSTWPDLSGNGAVARLTRWGAPPLLLSPFMPLW